MKRSDFDMLVVFLWISAVGIAFVLVRVFASALEGK